MFPAESFCKAFKFRRLQKRRHCKSGFSVIRSQKPPAQAANWVRSCWRRSASDGEGESEDGV